MVVDFYLGLLSFVYISYLAFMIYVGGGLVRLQGRQFQDVVGSNESILGLLWLEGHIRLSNIYLVMGVGKGCPPNMKPSL